MNKQRTRHNVSIARERRAIGAAARLRIPIANLAVVETAIGAGVQRIDGADQRRAERC